MIFLNQEPFPLQKTLLIALIGAIIGQSLVSLITWLKRKIDLYRKKQMIFNDLNNQNEILTALKIKHFELKQLFEKRETDQFTTSIFQNLQLDIYQSVQKNELYSIFKKDLSILVDIYKTIEFLTRNSPYWIYDNYLKKSEKLYEEKKEDDKHNPYCETEIRFIEIALKNIENNLKTIEETQLKIEKLTE